MSNERAKEDAMLRWWIASERGIETAQNNLAYILDQGMLLLRLSSLIFQWLTFFGFNQTRVSSAKHNLHRTQSQTRQLG